MAQEVVQATLTRRRGTTADLRVWTWDELWIHLRRDSRDGPMVLGTAGIRAVLTEAIRRAGQSPPEEGFPELYRTAGYRRHLQAQFQHWQRAGVRPESLESPTDESRVNPFDVAAYRIYDELLTAHDLANPDRLALWGLEFLLTLPPDAWPAITVFDPPADNPIALRALAELERHAVETRVGLLADLDQPLPFARALALRKSLLVRGYEESRVAPADRPEGLKAMARHLATDGALAIEATAGLRINGVPRGEGMALGVARRVQDLLDGQVRPDDIVVAVPQWDDQSEAIPRMLGSWGIPAATLGSTAMAADTGMSTLLLAMRLPLPDVDYEKAGLLRLLRASRFRPQGALARDPRDFAIAAAALQGTRAFRGLDAYRTALDRVESARPRASATESERQAAEQRAANARTARAVLDELAAALGSLRAPAPWWEHADRLLEVWRTLGLGADSEPAFQSLQLAMDDQALALDSMGLLDEPWETAAFVAEVSGIIAEETIESPIPPPGRVRIARVEQLSGVSVPHLLVANMVEGTFPARAAIEADLDAALDSEIKATTLDGTLPDGYASELSRFLRLIGAASRSLSLFYPTADESGRAMLPSAFLQDTLRGLGRSARDPSIHDRVMRFPAILPESLAKSPLERQVRAIDLAARGEFDSIQFLMRESDHRPALLGAGAVLHLASHRSAKRTSYGPFDGHLTDREAVDRIAGEQAASPPVFSASQLESLALCPFQYFLRYVLHLPPPDDRDELDPDYAAEGSVLHEALERLHLRLRDAPGPPDSDLVVQARDGIHDAIEQVLAQQPVPTTQLDQSLRAIESARARKAGTRYADQFATYWNLPSPPGIHPTCLDCEAEFGTPGEGHHPALIIGPQETGVRLRGVIDRIDSIEHEGIRYIRVIDYKSGSGPSSSNQKRGIYMQLPLYMMAVERVILSNSLIKPLDAGYWSLREKGYSSSRNMHTWKDKEGAWLEDSSWPGFRDALESYVVALVDRLRAGDFPVHPRVEDCRRYCDYASVCRIGQIARMGKVWPRQPRLANPKAGPES